LICASTGVANSRAAAATVPTVKVLIAICLPYPCRR
jgi:hypothetical protein